MQESEPFIPTNVSEMTETVLQKVGKNKEETMETKEEHRQGFLGIRLVIECTKDDMDKNADGNESFFPQNRENFLISVYEFSFI